MPRMPEPPLWEREPTRPGRLRRERKERIQRRDSTPGQIGMAEMTAVPEREGRNIRLERDDLLLPTIAWDADSQEAVPVRESEQAR